MSKTIGLMTWTFGENYGTTLQCYAMQIFIKKLGFDCIAISYDAQSSNIAKKLKKNPYKTLCTIFVRQIKRLKKSLPFVYEKQTKRHNRFILFRKNFFITTSTCTSKNDLISLNNKFDAFICGSDQIWNPFNFDSCYFLDFVFDCNKRIAYAPSFGTSNIDSSKNVQKILNLIKTFCAISVREKNGAEWIYKKLGRVCEVLLDPVFLLNKDDWIKVSNMNLKLDRKYILCYFLGQNEIYWKEIFNYSKKNNLDVVIIPNYKKDFSRCSFVFDDIGPAEFISLINNAFLVCTDSFHGTCFSILFEKSFTTFYRFSEKDKNNQNIRVFELLEKFGLTSRFFTRKHNLEKIFSSKIEYSKVNEIIEDERKKSSLFLENALQTSFYEVSNV